MRISLSEIMNLSSEPQKQVIPLELDRFERMQVSYPVTEKEDAVLLLSNLGNRKVKVGLRGRVVLQVPCDRCLEPQRVELPFSAEEEIDFNESDEKRMEDFDKLSYIDGYDLDVDRMVYEEILLGFPMKVLCQDDCKGICKVCGANLNQGECGCDRTEPDPRMSVIRDIFNNVKEV